LRKKQSRKKVAGERSEYSFTAVDIKLPAASLTSRLVRCLASNLRPFTIKNRHKKDEEI